MKSLMQDPMFLYGVAFVIFLALAFVFGRKPALKWIDGEIAQIRSELDTARLLRADAEASLAECKEKQRQAELDAKSIISNARQQVEVMRKQAEIDLAASLTRHQQIAAERIRMAEAEAISDVRKAAIDAALTLARQTLKDTMGEKDASRLIDQAIAEIPSLKKAKPKAA